MRPELLDHMFEKEDWKSTFRGCKLTATTIDGQTVIRVDGKNAENVKSITLGPKKLPVEMAMEIPEQRQEAKLEVTYVQVDQKFLPCQYHMILEVAGMGEIQVGFAQTYKKAQTYHVWDTLTSTIGMGAQVLASCRLSFSEYKFDDEVRAKK